MSSLNSTYLMGLIYDHNYVSLIYKQMTETGQGQSPSRFESNESVGFLTLFLGGATLCTGVIWTLCCSLRAGVALPAVFHMG